MTPLTILCLVGALLGATEAHRCRYSEGVCGPRYEALDVKPYTDADLEKITGEWFVSAYYDNQNRFFGDTECLHYHYDKTTTSDVIQSTRHQRLFSGERRQIDQRITFTPTNNEVVYKQDLSNNDPPLYVKLVDYNLEGPENDQYVIYYGCTNEGTQNFTIFLALTRIYDEAQSQTVQTKLQEAKTKTNMLHPTRSFFSSKCGKEDPEWTTTTSASEST